MLPQYYVTSLKGRAGEITGTTNKLELQYIMYNKSNADEKHMNIRVLHGTNPPGKCASNTTATWTKALHIIHGGWEARILIPYTGDTLAT